MLLLRWLLLWILCLILGFNYCDSITCSLFRLFHWDNHWYGMLECCFICTYPHSYSDQCSLPLLLLCYCVGQHAFSSLLCIIISQKSSSEVVLGWANTVDQSLCSFGYKCHLPHMTHPIVCFLSSQRNVRTTNKVCSLCLTRRGEESHVVLKYIITSGRYIAHNK